MSLISPSDQAKLREEFARMTRPVRLLFFTQTLACETCPETRQILDELPALSDKIVIDEVNLILERDKAAQYGIDRAPSVVLAYTDEGAPEAVHDTRIRFVGTPAGYEFISLVQAVLLAGGRAPQLSAESRQRLSALDRPVTLQVFTTPT
jgi:alkyl hydroperoxide reductase subunit AhpF